MTTSHTIPKRGELGGAVGRHISTLQRRFLAGESGARGDLATLRTAAGRPVEVSPQTWEITLAVVPENMTWSGDEPSWAERSTHAAITLYALHQQSLSVPAHRPGVGFGVAARRLSRSQSSSAKAVERRFSAAVAAYSVPELIIHLQPLITQMRSEKIGLDYGSLAEDFLTLLRNPRDHRPRLSWSRDFYRTTPGRDEDTNTTSSERK